MRPILKYSIYVILLFLIVLRFLSLEIDPPYFFAGYTQAHLTDPYHLTLFARNVILFDDWDPFDFDRWNVFKYSLVSGMAYIIFLLFGISRVTANLTGLLLNLGGIFLFASALINLRSRREIVVFILIILGSSLFLFYSRLPFLENGLIFLSGLLFFIFIKYGRTKWGQFLSGFIIALAALAGKLFGLLLFGPVMAGLIFFHKRKSFIPIVITLAGMLAGTILYLLVFYSGDISVLRDYYLEQTTGMYGADIGFGSPIVLVQKLLTYGSTNGLLGLAPFFMFITLLGFITGILTISKIKNENLPVVFCAVWIIIGVAGLMPFNYRPLRYMTFLFLPMSLLAAYAVNLIFEKDRPKLILSRKMLTLPLIFFLFWYLLTQIVCLFYPREEIVSAVIAIMPLTGAGAFILTLITYRTLKSKGRMISRYLIVIVMVPLLTGYTVRQGIMIYQGYAIPGHYLQQYSAELGQILDSEAVVTGPYAPALTLDNNLKAVIYHFGLSDIEKDLFERFPITHVVTDFSNWQRAEKDFPFLNSSLMLAKFIVRDFSVYIYRLPDANVEMTNYEQGLDALYRGEADSALIFLDRFTRDNPVNILGLRALSEGYSRADRMIDQVKVLRVMSERFPDNYRVHVHCYNAYLQAYKASGREELKMAMAYHLGKIREINPKLIQEDHE